MAKNARNIRDAVRELCLSFPEAEEASSHAMPDYKVRGKTFAMFTVNHHGDGRIALWLHSPAGAAQLHVQTEPEYYFVPPYVGSRGWLGVHLDKGNDWRTIAARVRDAYANVAPAALATNLGEPQDIEPPTETIDPEDFDPLSAPHAREKLQALRAWVGELPSAPPMSAKRRTRPPYATQLLDIAGKSSVAIPGLGAKRSVQQGPRLGQLARRLPPALQGRLESTPREFTNSSSTANGTSPKNRAAG